MPEMESSIHNAAMEGYQAALDNGNGNGNGEPDAPNNNQEPDKGNQDSPDNKGSQDDKPGEGKDPQGDNKDQPTGEPSVDPDKGTYEGEYNKDRFNGLMGQWQKDRSRAAQLEKEIADLKKGTQPQNPQPPSPAPKEIKLEEIPLPPELQGADDETKHGYRIMMRGAMTEMKNSFQQQIADLQKSTIDAIMNKLSEPARQQTEELTKVNSEIEELTVEFGKEFKDNVKEVLDFAVKEKYPLGTLRQAYNAWSHIKRLSGGKKDVQNFENKQRQKGDIPNSGAPRNGVIPKFDPEKDQNKSIQELLDEGLNS